MTRTVWDAARLLEVLAGYDPNDPVTAYAAGEVPDSYTAGLDADGLRGARIGVIRESMDPKTDPEADDYRQVRAVMAQAIADLQTLGAPSSSTRSPSQTSRLCRRRMLGTASRLNGR